MIKQLVARLSKRLKGIRVTSPKGIALIKEYEGCRLKAYQDAVGVWTIGYGHTKNVNKGDRVTQEGAEELLRTDLRIYEEAVNRKVLVKLKQHQFDALVSFTYNLGIGALSRSTLLKKLNKSDFDGAANEFLKWNKAGGRVLRGLVRRRNSEADMFRGL